MDKLSHEAVNFEHPAKGIHMCGQCIHYEKRDSCEIVKPPIEPEDWCKKFKESK